MTRTHSVETASSLSVETVFLVFETLRHPQRVLESSAELYQSQALGIPTTFSPISLTPKKFRLIWVWGRAWEVRLGKAPH